MINFRLDSTPVTALTANTLFLLGPQVSGDTAVSEIKTRLAKELTVAPGSQVCFNGLPLADDATMTSAGVGNQDLLLITKGGGGSVSPSLRNRYPPTHPSPPPSLIAMTTMVLILFISVEKVRSLSMFDAGRHVSI